MVRFGTGKYAAVAGVVLAIALSAQAGAEPPSSKALEYKPTADLPALSGEVSVPSAPRPEHIEPMVAPVKRVAPKMPENKAKASGTIARVTKKSCDGSSKTATSKGGCNEAAKSSSAKDKSTTATSAGKTATKSETKKRR